MRTSKRSKQASAEVLAYQDVTVRYGTEVAVEQASFTVRAGDFVALIGPNGAGKTTLLKAGLGLLEYTGTIRLFGEPLPSFRDWHRVGYVPQRAAIDAQFPASVEEVVGLGGTDTARALATVNMQEYAKRRIGALSGGQQQRVLIARALAARPDLLALDEPATGVDRQRQRSFYELLATLNKRGITILLVTHDPERVSKHVSKVACVHRTVTFHESHEEFCAQEEGDWHILNHIPGERRA